MKAIFYLLLLANGVFFIWDYTNPYQSYRQRAAAQELPTLELARKLPENSRSGETQPKARGTGAGEPGPPPSDQSALPAKGVPASETEGHHVDYPQPGRSERTPASGDTTDLAVTKRPSATAAASEPGDADPSGAASASPAEQSLLAGFSENGGNQRQPQQCFRLGGFEAREQAVHAGNLLQGMAVNQTVMELETEVPMGYWVLYPSLGDYAAAEAKVTELKDLGITEIWLFRDGPRRGDISLGLFKSHERAVSQSEMLADRGVPSEIQRWTGLQPRYWLRFQSEQNPQEIDSMLHTGLSVSSEWQITVDIGCAVTTASN